MTQAQSGEAPAQARGVQVILLLAVLTLAEYGVAVALAASTVALVLLLTAVALLKAWLIVMYFMHVTRVWRGEEAHE
jgi:heme/copper-type cytochrome/quinol oxidase subunit 4